jgi:hypothetical protein
MKKTVGACFLIVLAALCVSAAPNAAADDNRLSFFVEPLLQKGLGGTAYDLYYDKGGGQADLSRLEFPMASLEAGITAGLSIQKNGKRAWLFEASITHSTFAWQARMQDYDWFGLSGYPSIPWSYTYSADTTTSWSASADAAWTFRTLGPLSLSLYATYRYQYAFHVENTFTGWQYDQVAGTDFTLVPWFVDPAPDGIEYTLTAHEPGLGLMADLEALPGLSLELRAAFTPVYISDVDDHKLRTKLSTASGWGAGLYANLRAIYQFPKYYKGFSSYIALDGELIYYSVSTTQTQYWYGNADALNGSPQGTRYTGVGHVVTSTQYQIGLRFGFAL